MDSAWAKENQDSGRIVRFVSSEYFCSGQFVHNYSISGPNCLVCFVHLALHTANVYQAERFTAGEFPQARAVSGHFRCCGESSAICPPHPCHHLLSWTLFPCSKAKQSTSEYFPCLPFREIQQKQQVYFIGSMLEGCLSVKEAPSFCGPVAWGTCPTGQFLSIKPLSLLQEKDAKSFSTIRWMCCPAMPPYICISVLCFY